MNNTALYYILFIFINAKILISFQIPTTILKKIKPCLLFKLSARKDF